MKTSLLMYGDPAEVSNELCSCNEPEEVLHVDLIAALGNALNRIARLESQAYAKPELIDKPTNTTPMSDCTCGRCDKFAECIQSRPISVCDTDQACLDYVHSFSEKDAI